MRGSTFQDQKHPLYDHDRKLIDHLLATPEPLNQEIIDAARLFIRYDGAHGSFDIQHDLLRVLENWKMSRDDLNLAAKLIWTGNWRPESHDDTQIGSGADVSTD